MKLDETHLAHFLQVSQVPMLTCLRTQKVVIMWLGSLLLHVLILVCFIYVSNSHDVRYTSLFFKSKHNLFIHYITS
jgi:hypothetical protein